MARSNKIDVEASLVKARLLGGGVGTLFDMKTLRNFLTLWREYGLDTHGFHPDWQEIIVYETPTDR